MILWHCHAKPDKRQQRIRQPIQPTEIPHPLSAREPKIQPHIKKLVEADAGDKGDFETARQEVLAAYVVVLFSKRRILVRLRRLQSSVQQGNPEEKLPEPQGIPSYSTER